MNYSLLDTETFSWKRRRDRVHVLVIVLLAAVLRVIYYTSNTHNNPAFGFPILDSLFHHEWATALAAGDTLGNDAYFRAPLYPYLMSWVYRVSTNGIAQLVALQHVFGCVSTVLLYLFARRYFAPVVALVSGLIAASYWPLIFFEGELLIVTVFITLSLAALLATSLALEKATLTRLLVSGALFGLAAITRPSILVVVAVVPLLFYIARSKKDAVKHCMIRAMFVWIAAAVVISPVMIRNYKVARAFVPIASSGGVNFYIGNNAEADGKTAIVPGTDAPWMGGNTEAIAIASQQAGRRLTAAETSSHYFRQGMKWIAANPVPAFRLWLRKLALFWEGPERSNEKFMYYFWQKYGPGAPLPAFWIMAPFALAGLALLWGQRRRLALPMLYVAVYMLGVIAFFVNSRLRMPVVPVLIMFAAFAVVGIVTMLRRREFRSAALPVAVAVVAFVAINAGYPSFLRSKPIHLTISYYTEANALLQQQKIDAAIAEYKKARANYEAHPSDSYVHIAKDVYLKLGGLYYQRNMCPEAVDAFKHVHGIDHKSIIAAGLMAECLEKEGRFDEAIAAYRRVLDVMPNHTGVMVGLARCYEATGRVEEARKIRRRLTGD